MFSYLPAAVTGRGRALDWTGLNWREVRGSDKDKVNPAQQGSRYGDFVSTVVKGIP